MAEAKFRTPKGTFDLLPDDSRQRRRLARSAAEVFERAGYGQISTPIFEDTDLFERGVGTSTDIVRKEMFTFEDKGGRSFTLRPEGTAPICRAYVEHGMHKLPQPVKLSYSGPFFRHERPQAGRYRQFHQIGAEAIGTESPLADVEVVVLLRDLLEELGVPGYTLQIGSLGSIEARRDYLELLKGHLRDNSDSLSDDVRERIEINPLRAFDSDHSGTRSVMESAPALLDHLSPDDDKHFERVLDLLEAASVPYSIDRTLVRGLDYYTRTIFSFVCDQLGAQSEIGGGGRYDGLIRELGGPETPAVGWAAGVERILLALDESQPESGRDVFVVVTSDDHQKRAVALVNDLRKKGMVAEIDLAGRSLKGQLKHADRIGARKTVIFEPDGGAQIKDMESGEQAAVETGDLLDALTAASSRK